VSVNLVAGQSCRDCNRERRPFELEQGRGRYEQGRGYVHAIDVLRCQSACGAVGVLDRGRHSGHSQQCRASAVVCRCSMSPRAQRCSASAAFVLDWKTEAIAIVESKSWLKWDLRAKSGVMMAI